MLGRESRAHRQLSRVPGIIEEIRLPGPTDDRRRASPVISNSPLTTSCQPSSMSRSAAGSSG
jgi:hypothetical protein